MITQAGCPKVPRIRAYHPLRGLSGAFRTGAERHLPICLKPGGYIEITDADPAADAIHVLNAPKNMYGSIFVAAMWSAADDAGYSRDGDHAPGTSPLATDCNW